MRPRRGRVRGVYRVLRRGGVEEFIEGLRGEGVYIGPWRGGGV